MTPQKQEAVKAAAAKVATVAKKAAPAVLIKSGSQLVNSRKIGLVGEAGSGKTHFLIAPILAGQNVFVLSTDLGGNGLATIEGHLKALGEGERFEKQVRGVDMSSVGAVMGYLAGKYDDQILAGGWVPHVEAWDGFSTYNAVTVDRAVYAEGQDKFAHWGKVMRSTLHPAEMFFARKIGDYHPHKIITFADKETEEESKSGVTTEKIEPFIQGGARKVLKLGFDLVLYLWSKDVREKVRDPKTGKEGVVSKTKFYYRSGGSTVKFPVKNRSFKDIPEVMEADPVHVWAILMGKGGEAKV